MNICGQNIAQGERPFVIAEIGVNHDGDIRRAHELVDAACDAGADAVKVQFFRTALLLGDDAGLASYQKDAGETDAAAMLQRLELKNDELREIAEHARERAVAAVCTVFTPELVDEAEEIGFDAYKVASPDVVNRLLVDRLAATGRPLILSTGAATLDEIERSLSWTRGAGMRLALMHCVSAYPTPDDEATLGAVRTLGDRFGLPAGYSDHTSATDTGALAVAAGACVLEKHLTYSCAASGPDHSASLEPAAFGEYVRLAQRAYTMLRGGEKNVLSIEGDVRSLARQSLALLHEVARGDRITPAALTTRRPGNGLAAAAPEAVVGRTATRDLASGTVLSEEDLA